MAFASKSMFVMKATVAKSPKPAAFVVTKAPKVFCCDSMTSNALTTPLTPVVQSYFSTRKQTETASSDFASEADGRNQGNEPTKDVPEGANPRSWFTDGDESNSRKKTQTEWKKNAKDDSFPGFDPKHADEMPDVTKDIKGKNIDEVPNANLRSNGKKPNSAEIRFDEKIVVDSNRKREEQDETKEPPFFNQPQHKTDFERHKQYVEKRRVNN